MELWVFSIKAIHGGKFKEDSSENTIISLHSCSNPGFIKLNLNKKVKIFYLVGKHLTNYAAAVP